MSNGCSAQTVYLDTAASMLMTPAALQALREYYAQPWAGANPNSLHEYGRLAFAALERSRKTLARCVGAHSPHEIILTSGGTESDNAALHGIARAYRRKTPQRSVVLISSIEHEAVDQAALSLRRDGFEVCKIPVSSQGVVKLDRLQALLNERPSQVALVSVMMINNEIATVQPIKEIAEMVHTVGAYMHTDAVQSVGHIPVDVKQLGVDALTFTAHKLGGPVGVGALYLKRQTPFDPFVVGGGQERGLRSGTQDVAGALAFAAAAQDRVDLLEQNYSYLTRLRNKLYYDLEQRSSGLIKPLIDLSHGKCHPAMVCVTVLGHEAETLILRMSEKGFMIASGSACSSSSQEPSHILKELGIPADRIFGSLRISFDERVAESDLERCADALIEAIAQ